MDLVDKLLKISCLILTIFVILLVTIITFNFVLLFKQKTECNSSGVIGESIEFLKFTNFSLLNDQNLNHIKEFYDHYGLIDSCFEEKINPCFNKIVWLCVYHRCIPGNL